MRLSKAQEKLLGFLKQGGECRVYERTRQPVVAMGRAGSKGRGVSRASLDVLKRAGLVWVTDPGVGGWALAKPTEEGLAYSQPKGRPWGAALKGRSSSAAAKLGRAGGAASTEAKRRAARENGRKGGRKPVVPRG